MLNQSQSDQKSAEEIYREFFYNPDNIMKCRNCPDNKGIPMSQCYQGHLPCGQQHCWVTVHCYGVEED